MIADARPRPWTPFQKIGFRLLFTVGGGLMVLSLYGNAGLMYILRPVYTVLANLGSLVARGRGVHFQPSNVGDTMAIWCAHLGWILVALVLTAVWTALDRHRTDYRSLAGLLYQSGRFVLMLSMIIYGMAKVIPTQMGFMALPAYQLQLTGDTSPMNVLWGFMGASTPYSVVTGMVELSAGLLLLWRRTWLLGSLLAVIAMAQVFLLNLFYDVPVKLVAGGLLLVAIGLTSPYWPNLARTALNLGPTRPVELWPAAGAGRRWLRRLAIGANWVLGVGALIALTAFGIGAVVGMHSVKSPADGIWRATSFTVDGAEAGLQSSPAPWMNIAVSARGAGYAGMTTQTPSGYVTMWSLKSDGDQLTIRKRRSDPPTVLTFRTEGPDRLVLTGTVDGHRLEGRYVRRAMERDAKPGFRLIQPDPDTAAPGGGVGE